MKVIAAILSIYFLGLTIVPCTDSETSHADEIGINAVHAPHGSATDACTPFCSCQCCQSQISVFGVPQVAAVPLSSYLVKDVYREKLGQDIRVVLFQPPIV